MAIGTSDCLADRVIKARNRGILKKLASPLRETESVIKTDFPSMPDLLQPCFHNIESLFDRKGPTIGMLSGFGDLDSMTSGFKNSDLIVVAGQPSMGKTSFALNIAMNAATEYGRPTAIFSLEMSKEQIALRILCAKAKVNLKSLRTGYLTPEDWGRLTLTVGNISDSPLYVDDTPAISTLEIRAKARRLKKETDLGLIIVDYLQLMKGPGRGDAREKEISEISRSLKALAKELNIPVIALSQLNRKVEERPNRRPQLADLRESGAIEQDADVIIFIYRDEVYNKIEDKSQKGETEIIISKQPSGPMGMAIVYFDVNYLTPA
jgi:replicative DNA helicase